MTTTMMTMMMVMMMVTYNGHIADVMSMLCKYYEIFSEIFIMSNFRKNLHELQ